MCSAIGSKYKSYASHHDLFLIIYLFLSRAMSNCYTTSTTSSVVTEVSNIPEKVGP
jgi:hypothetical protein